MTICHLADCPEAMPEIARWLFEEWGRFIPGASVELGLLRLQERLQRGRLPLTLVAWEGECVIGTVSLTACDMESRPDLAPWLASLYVVPAQRRRGIGPTLVQAAVAEARGLGMETLYLFTDNCEAFYSRLGWQRMESCIYQERQVVIMRKALRFGDRAADASGFAP